MTTPKSCLCNALLCLACMAAIYFGGIAFLRWLDRGDRSRIDRNGAQVQAIVYRKTYQKGHLVYFEYTYKGLKYYNHEQGNDLYDTLELGETVTIKLDSTAPEDSYIITALK